MYNALMPTHGYRPGKTRPFYLDADFEDIAAAIDMPISAIKQHAAAFESAGSRYFSWHDRQDNGRRIARPTPSIRRQKLRKVETAATRLLKALTVESADRSADGPTDRDLLETLTYPRLSSEDRVLQLIGRIVEVEQLAREASKEVERLGKLTMPHDNVGGDPAVNPWIAELLQLYELIASRPAGSSIGAPGTDQEGVAGGPAIRFLKAAAKPLSAVIPKDPAQTEKLAAEIWNLRSSALRSRVRSILRANRKKK